MLTRTKQRHLLSFNVKTIMDTLEKFTFNGFINLLNIFQRYWKRFKIKLSWS